MHFDEVKNKYNILMTIHDHDYAEVSCYSHITMIASNYVHAVTISSFQKTFWSHIMLGMLHEDFVPNYFMILCDYGMSQIHLVMYLHAPIKFLTTTKKIANFYDYKLIHKLECSVKGFLHHQHCE